LKGEGRTGERGLRPRKKLGKKEKKRGKRHPLASEIGPRGRMAINICHPLSRRGEKRKRQQLGRLCRRKKGYRTIEKRKKEGRN